MANRTMWAWVGITLVFIFGIFIPSIFGIEGMHGGYAISFFCILLTITGIVVVVIYIGRVRALEQMLRHKNLLAYWTYTPQEWQAYTEKNFAEEKSERWGLYWLVMAIALIICFGFWLFNRDSGFVMIIITFGLAVLLAATIFITTGFDHRQNRKHAGNVYITKNGALVNGKLHLWHSWGARIESIDYLMKDELIKIIYSLPNRGMRSTYNVRIPVPRGQEEKAQQIVSLLSKSTGPDADNV